MPDSNFFEFFESSSGSDFVRIADGDQVNLRLLSKPISGFEVFSDGKPVRWKPDAPVPDGLQLEPGDRPRKFAAFVVGEYARKDNFCRIKVWSLTQKTILDQMANHFGSGRHWSEIELAIIRRGTGKSTTYSVTGIQSDCQPELLEFAAKADEYICLENLYTGETPFLQSPPQIELNPPKVAKNADDLPF